MTKTACIFRNETNEVRESGVKTVSLIPKMKAEKRFRDDGMCPECFAEMVLREGITTCDLCGYVECD
ncbi:MAG: hypothetical protein LHV68_09910 [Elusimicrobia bacterium]|nr:hypothetical protein [Candidatus Liberimonas magnetica]